jgi:hypothetical protein
LLAEYAERDRRTAVTVLPAIFPANTSHGLQSATPNAEGVVTAPADRRAAASLEIVMSGEVPEPMDSTGEPSGAR